MYPKEDKSFIGMIKENWAIILFMTSVIITWANFINADATADRRLSKLEEVTNSQQSAQTQILTQLSQIQTDISWIKLRLK